MEKTELINPTVLKATVSIAFSLVGCLLYHRSKRNDISTSSASSSPSCLSSPSPSSTPCSSSSSSNEPSEENYVTGNEYDESELGHEGHPQEALLEHVNSLFVKLEATEADRLRPFEVLVCSCQNVEQGLREASARIMVLEQTIKNRLEKKAQLPRLRRRVVILQARATAMSRNERDTRKKFSEIKELKDEVADLTVTNVKLQTEKAELTKKLSTLEGLASSMVQTPASREGNGELCSDIKDHKREPIKKIEELQMSRSPDFNEVVYLRWSNACLRYELIRNKEQKKVSEIEEKEMEEAVEEIDEKCTNFDLKDDSSSTAETSEVPLDVGPKNIGNTPKRRFCHKLKRWVKGNDRICQL